MKCTYCDKEFTPQRSTAKYCSPGCRKLAFQGLSVPGVTVTVVNAELVAGQSQGIAIASDPDVQKIWDLHRAQRRPIAYTGAGVMCMG